MSADEDIDKSLDATPHKLEKAREKGQVSKSNDVTSVVIFGATLLYISWEGSRILISHFYSSKALLIQAFATQINQSTVEQLAASAIRSTATLFLPLLLIIMLSAIIGNIAQIGLIISTEPLEPDLQKLNPAAGIKRIFSLRTVFDAARATIKLLLLAGLAWVSLKTIAKENIYQFAALNPIDFLRFAIDKIVNLMSTLLLALIVVAFVDYIYSRREYAKKMRMSHREVKDEHKNREGDPRIKSRIRELRQQHFQRSKALHATQGADVLITNPTHIAVALKYDHGQMQSPLLLAKGQGKQAQAMRDIAHKKKIPVIHSPTLARQIFAEIQPAQSIPPHLYAAVARIIVWVYAMRDSRDLSPNSPATA
ncbi:EscU/YscU/HrcU family type III secretion system export apparatus switch protein [Acidovorax facilis]|uniref:EscU/YscU/HrcU family type III secretion system export apparatus switch protein n=1 Tax=Acidovorax facilis TaxID=12917 RepID=UPI003CEB0008